MITILLVLMFGLLGAPAAGQAAFQLQRGDGQTIQKQHHIQRILIGFAVIQLARHTQAVVSVLRPTGRVFLIVGGKQRHPKLFAVHLEALTQHLEHAFDRQLLGQAVKHDPGGFVFVDLLQVLPHQRLGTLDKRQYLCWLQCQGFIKFAV